MPKPGTAVHYNDGNETALALVTNDHGGNVIDLIYFPTTSPVEHATSVPEGEGGVTWSTIPDDPPAAA